MASAPDNPISFGDAGPLVLNHPHTARETTVLDEFLQAGRDIDMYDWRGQDRLIAEAGGFEPARPPAGMAFVAMSSTNPKLCERVTVGDGTKTIRSVSTAPRGLVIISSLKPVGDHVSGLTLNEQQLWRFRSVAGEIARLTTDGIEPTTAGIRLSLAELLELRVVPIADLPRLRQKIHTLSALATDNRPVVFAASA